MYDNYWYQDKKLYQQVKKMNWDKVILDEDMKKEISETANKFFTSRDVYDDLGVPWKRGKIKCCLPHYCKHLQQMFLPESLLTSPRPPIPWSSRQWQNHLNQGADA